MKTPHGARGDSRGEALGLRRAAHCGGLALASALPWVFASCAATDDGNVRPADASTVLETGSIDAGADVDEGGLRRVGPELRAGASVRCEDADFCPVPTNVTTSTRSRPYGARARSTSGRRARAGR